MKPTTRAFLEGMLDGMASIADPEGVLMQPLPVTYTAYVIAFLSGDRITRVRCATEFPLCQRLDEGHRVLLARSDVRSTCEKAVEQAERRFARLFPTVHRRFPIDLERRQREAELRRHPLVASPFSLAAARTAWR